MSHTYIHARCITTANHHFSPTHIGSCDPTLVLTHDPSRPSQENVYSRNAKSLCGHHTTASTNQPSASRSLVLLFSPPPFPSRLKVLGALESTRMLPPGASR